MMKFVPALALLIAAGPAFAQGSTQSPPAPNAGPLMPQTSNSLPPGAANMNTNSTQNPNLAGQAVGGTVSGAAPVGTSPTTPTPQSR